jgi:hypothetical protein
MNKRTLLYGLAYCVCYILFKLYIIYGGYALTRFGFFYSHVIAVVLIIPFYYLAVKNQRDREMGGFIGGREAIRAALGVFAVGAVIASVYNYLEYEYSGKDLAIGYYNSEQFTDYLLKKNVKPRDFDKIIAEQVANSKDAGFKATTGKLFSMLIIGVSGALIVGTLMRRTRTTA